MEAVVAGMALSAAPGAFLPLAEAFDWLGSRSDSTGRERPGVPALVSLLALLGATLTALYLWGVGAHQGFVMLAPFVGAAVPGGLISPLHSDRRRRLLSALGILLLVLAWAGVVTRLVLSSIFRHWPEFNEWAGNEDVAGIFHGATFCAAAAWSWAMALGVFTELAGILKAVGQMLTFWRK